MEHFQDVNEISQCLQYRPIMHGQPHISGGPFSVRHPRLGHLCIILVESKKPSGHARAAKLFGTRLEGGKWFERWVAPQRSRPTSRTWAYSSQDPAVFSSSSEYSILTTKQYSSSVCLLSRAHSHSSVSITEDRDPFCRGCLRLLCIAVNVYWRYPFTETPGLMFLRYIRLKRLSLLLPKAPLP